MVDILSSPSNQSEQALKISGPIFISTVKSLNSYCVWFPTQPGPRLPGGSPGAGGRAGETPHPQNSSSQRAWPGAAGGGKITKGKGGESGRSVPFAGDGGGGRRGRLSPLALLPSLPFPHPGGWSLQCAADAFLLPLASLALGAGFTISLSSNVSIVLAGCPAQNSLKGPRPVQLSAKSTVLPNPANPLPAQLPACPSCPLSHGGGWHWLIDQAP